MSGGQEQACLVIADISGYTGYLAGSELDHAQDVLADLLETTIGTMGPILRLNKLEGDAVFLYAPEAEIDGSLLLDTLESAYFTFQRRLRTIRQATTCQCNACRTIPNLNVKFCAHHGAFVRQRIMGQEELAGRDVILVHRLLKNRVAERFGLRGYAVLTEACTQRMRIDPQVLGMRAHSETYEAIGDVPMYVYDLEARWRHELETRRTRVTPEEADMVFDYTLEAPLPLVWEWVTDASRRPQWAGDVTRVDIEIPGGRRGVGTTNHCVHGKAAHLNHLEEIVDWRPFEYQTYRMRGPEMPEMLVTDDFEVVNGGTRMRMLVRIQTPEVRAMMADPAQRPMFEQMRAEVHGHFIGDAERLAKILREIVAQREREVQAAEAARAQLREQATHYWEARESWVEAPTSR